MKKVRKESTIQESLFSKIKENQVKFSKLKQSTKTNLKLLSKLVDEQSSLLDMLKENCKSDLYQKLGSELQIQSTEAKSITKIYNSLSNRKVIDKIFLEHLGIIEKTKVKTHKKSNIVKRSKICELAKMGSRFRDLLDGSEVSDDEKKILMMMLEDIKKDIRQLTLIDTML